MKHEDKYQWFDLIRGVSALVVVCGHLRPLSFMPYSAQGGNVLATLFFFLTGFGHQAVVIFFVLSGFFIVKTIHESVISGRWLLSEYAFNRLSRLWIVLIPALFMTLLFDTLGLWLFKDSLAYNGKIPFMEGVSPIGKLEAVSFFGNIFFLQSIITPTYGSNGALWSLANEFWYYVLFPMMYFAFAKFYSPIVKCLLVLAACSILFFIGNGVALYFLIWLMGGLLYVIVKKDYLILKSRWVAIICAAILILTLAMIRLSKYRFAFNDFTLGLATMFLLASLSGFQIKPALAKITRFLANISFSVYVFHLPFSVFLTTCFVATPMSWSYNNLVFYSVMLIVVIVYSYLMYLLFEKNTFAIKKSLRSLTKQNAHAYFK